MLLELSPKCRYVLLAMLELAGHYQSGQRLQIRQIAARQNIPERYLEQLLLCLKQKSLVKSVRGPQGGYQLIREPKSISLLEIVMCVQGNDQPCQDLNSDGLSCEEYVIESTWQKAQKAANNILSTYTLQNLLDDRDTRSHGATMYYI